MTDVSTEAHTPLDEIGPVDYLTIEFPAETASFTGERADEDVDHLAAATDPGRAAVVGAAVTPGAGRRRRRI